jgi:IMP dehydrogenase
VLLQPRFSDVATRTLVNLGILLSETNWRFSLPIISAPMDTITEEKMILSLLEKGGTGVLHRYLSIPEQVEKVKNIQAFIRENPAKFPSSLSDRRFLVAIGVTGDYQERAEALWDVGVQGFCLDIAHGHHALMKVALKWLRAEVPNTTHIMAGNVATPEGYLDLSEWGADSVKVGIGGGSVCSTRLNTGHGVPTFQSLLECANIRKQAELQGTGVVKRYARIIADGGLKNPGDIVKALAVGADAVMLGSMLAGTSACPGLSSYDADDKHVVAYRGMSSIEAQEEWRGRAAAPEGIAVNIPYRGDLFPILDDMISHIRSGLSYSGAFHIPELQDRAVFVRQSVLSQRESGTHIHNVI